MFSRIEPFSKQNFYYNLDGLEPASPLNPKLPESIIPQLSEGPNPSNEFDSKFLKLINDPDFFTKFPFRTVVLQNINDQKLLEKLTKGFEAYFLRQVEPGDCDRSIMRENLNRFSQNTHLNPEQQTRLTKCFLRSFGQNETKAEILEKILNDSELNTIEDDTIIGCFPWTKDDLEKLCKVAYDNLLSSLTYHLSKLELSPEQFKGLISVTRDSLASTQNAAERISLKAIIQNLIRNPAIYKIENRDSLDILISLLDKKIKIDLHPIQNVVNQAQLSKITKIYKEQNGFIDKYFIEALAKNKNFSLAEFKEFLEKYTTFKGLGLEYQLSKHYSKPVINLKQISAFFDHLTENTTIDEDDDPTFEFASDLISSIANLDDTLFEKLLKSLSITEYDSSRNKILYALASSVISKQQIDKLIDKVDEVFEDIDNSIEALPSIDPLVTDMRSLQESVLFFNQSLKSLTEKNPSKFDLSTFIRSLFANKNINLQQIKHLLDILKPIMETANIPVTYWTSNSSELNQLKLLFLDRNDDKEFERFIQVAKKYPDSLSGKVYAYATTAA